MLRVGCCPPVVRRGEGTRSGAPSWTTAQTQAVQGCTVCVVPPDLLPEPREPNAGGRTSGGGLSFGDFSLATQRKVTRPSPKGGRNPVEGSALVSCMAKPCQSSGLRHRVMMLPTPHPGPLPQRGEGIRAKPGRGQRPRVLHGEAMPLRRGVAFARQWRYRTPHPDPLPQGERGLLPRTITLR